MTDQELKLAILNIAIDHLFIIFYLIVGVSVFLSCTICLYTVGSTVGASGIAFIGLPLSLTASLIWPITIVLAVFFLNKSLNSIPKIIELVPQILETILKLRKFFSNDSETDSESDSVTE